MQEAEWEVLLEDELATTLEAQLAISRVESGGDRGALRALRAELRAQLEPLQRVDLAAAIAAADEVVSRLADLRPNLEADLRLDEIEALRRRALSTLEQGGRPPHSAVALVHLIADLAALGWEFQIERGSVELMTRRSGVLETRKACWRRVLYRRPELGTSGRREAVRGQLLAAQRAQLREPGVSAFIKRLERASPGRSQPIFAAMRDGGELARALEAAKDSTTVIRPYLQVAEAGATCAETGLDLWEIWRYFRHTWVTPHRSTPGRELMLLVRDAAAEGHPVIGIAALSSAAAGNRSRDQAIGWDPDTFLARVRSAPPPWLDSWILQQIESRLSSLFLEDLLEDGLLSSAELDSPSAEVIERLKVAAAEAAARHGLGGADARRFSGRSSRELTDDEWRAFARSDLYRGKRSQEAAELLGLKLTAQEFLVSGQLDLAQLIDSPSGERLLRLLLRRAKADVMGTALAELSVCGAVPPYSHLTGGKLVALLALSPEAVALYRDKYSGAPSWIASGMAGRPVCRDADLAYVATSSLYRVRPCQYDRVRVPASELGAPHDAAVSFRYLGHTEGKGSLQFTQVTIQALDTLLRAHRQGGRKQRIFGEGANTRMRVIREALALLRVRDPGDLLQHDQQRLIYGAALLDNTLEYLLGIRPGADYILPQARPSARTRDVAEYWARRWLARRVARPEVLAAVASHTKTLPIRHGARVDLPRQDVEQSLLFEDP